MSDRIEWTVDRSVARVCLNRPDKRNAVNDALILQLTEAFDAASRDAGIRAIVLTGSDKAFAAGADIKEMSEKSFVEVFTGGDTRKSLGLTGDETVSIDGLDTIEPLQVVDAHINMADGSTKTIQVKCRIDTALRCLLSQVPGIRRFGVRHLFYIT